MPDQDQGGSGGVPLAACQLILATCQKLENNGRPPPDRFPALASCQNSWQGAKMCKSPRAEASRDSAMRGVRLHVYYIYFGQ